MYRSRYFYTIEIRLVLFKLVCYKFKMSIVTPKLSTNKTVFKYPKKKEKEKEKGIKMVLLQKID